MRVYWCKQRNHHGHEKLHLKGIWLTVPIALLTITFTVPLSLISAEGVQWLTGFTINRGFKRRGYNKPQIFTKTGYFCSQQSVSLNSQAAQNATGSIPISFSLFFRMAYVAGIPQHTFLVVVEAQLAKHGGYLRIELMADVAEQADRQNKNDLFPTKNV